MTCTHTDVGNGVTVTTCSRGRRRRAPCSVCGRREHELLCDYPLRGAKVGQTCSRTLCRKCAVRVGEQDLCPAHGKAAQGESGGSQ